MKKAIILSGLAAAALFSGCAVEQPRGMIYSDYTINHGDANAYPTSSGAKVDGLKKGVSTANGYVGPLVAIGDASISTAAKNGGISKIYYVDWKVNSILGIIEEYQCTVYGE